MNSNSANAPPSLFGAPPSAAPLTVAQLNRLVREALTSALPDRLSVVGELSNLSRPASGHIYFTLKDATSEVRCVMWRSDSATLKFRPTDGLAVVAGGTVDLYEPRGQYQFYVTRLEPRGVGALELAFRQLKERLAAEGLFDPARKRPIPTLPRTIVLVTSPSGAAIRDMLQTIRRRFPAVRVVVAPVRVQGDGAAAEIAAMIARVNALAASRGGIFPRGVDVMIVGRGGGSIEDLWAFNEEAVARAIVASAIPIVSAVGHETDFTIADFAADLRAATPTAAAELVVPVLGELLEWLAAQSGRLTRAAQGAVGLSRHRLDALARTEWLRDPRGRLRQVQQKLDEVAARLHLALTRPLGERRRALHDLEVRLARVRPEVALARRRERIAAMAHRLRWAAEQRCRQAEQRLGAAALRSETTGPAARLARDAEHLALTVTRLERALTFDLARRTTSLEGWSARLAAISHERVLQRGFSITRRARGGKIVRAAGDVRPDERIVTQTAGGEIASRVIDDRQGELFE